MPRHTGIVLLFFHVFLYRDTRVDYFIMEDPKGALRSAGTIPVLCTLPVVLRFFFFFLFLFFAYY